MSKARISQSVKPKFAEICRELSDLINGKTGERWPGNFKIYEPEAGRKQVLEEFMPRTVRPIAKAAVSNMLVKYTANTGSGIYALTEKQCREAVDYWIAETDPVPGEIYPIAFKDDAFYAWDRLEWNPLREHGECPHFDSIMGRVSNAEALKAWLGSLFIMQSARQQYVWIYGEGGEGKGALVRLFSRIFKHTHTPLEPTESTSQFWTSQLVGKRFCTINECENMKFITSGKFKSLTGGDKVKAEYKRENHFSFYPTCKIFISSNTKPAISSKNSDVRRLIYCAIEPLHQNAKEYPEKIFDELLWNEAPVIVDKCIKSYAKLCPTHGDIPCDSDNRELLSALTESRFQDIYDRFFELGKRPDPLRTLEWEKVSSSEVYAVLNAERLNDFDVHRFYEFLERKYHVQCRRVGDDRTRYMLGIRFKANVTRMIIKDSRRPPSLGGI